MLRTVTAVRTKPGTIAPKAILAAATPALGTLLAVLGEWGITGEFDRAELVTAVMGVAGSLLAFAGAWAGNPGDVEIPAAVSAETKRPGR